MPTGYALTLWQPWRVGWYQATAIFQLHFNLTGPHLYLRPTVDPNILTQCTSVCYISRKTEPDVCLQLPHVSVRSLSHGISRINWSRVKFRFNFLPFCSNLGHHLPLFTLTVAKNCYQAPNMGYGHTHFKSTHTIYWKKNIKRSSDMQLQSTDSEARSQPHHKLPVRPGAVAAFLLPPFPSIKCQK